MPARGLLPALTLAALVACALARPDISYPTKSSQTKELRFAELSKPSAAENNALVTSATTAVNKVAEATIVDQSLKDVQSFDNQVKQAYSAGGVVFRDPSSPRYYHVVSLNPPPSTIDGVLPLHRDVSKTINQRYPHAVLFGGTCGGSIISPKWILTAGHCTLFTGGRYVLAGTNNTADGSGTMRRIKKLYVHPLFSVGPYWLNARTFDIKQVAARWDFLLAELEEPLELDGTNIAAVPINEDLEVAPETYVGYAGYGTDHHGGTMRHEMHGMDLKTKPNEHCQKLLQFNKEDMLCAQGYEPEYNSACNGDSGSGLIGNGKLIGIASWVENDAFECKAGNTVVFSKVAAVRDWIRQVANV